MPHFLPCTNGDGKDGQSAKRRKATKTCKFSKSLGKIPSSIPPMLRTGWHPIWSHMLIWIQIRLLSDRHLAAQCVFCLIFSIVSIVRWPGFIFSPQVFCSQDTKQKEPELLILYQSDENQTKSDWLKNSWIYPAMEDIKNCSHFYKTKEDQSFLRLNLSSLRWPRWY